MLNGRCRIEGIQHDSKLRRGSPGKLAAPLLCVRYDPNQLRNPDSVAHMIYGVPQTINSANYVYFLALQEALKLSAGDSPPSQARLMSIITGVVMHVP